MQLSDFMAEIKNDSLKAHGKTQGVFRMKSGKEDVNFLPWPSAEVFDENG